MRYTRLVTGPAGVNSPGDRAMAGRGISIVGVVFMMNLASRIDDLAGENRFISQSFYRFLSVASDVTNDIHSVYDQRRGIQRYQNTNPDAENIVGR